MLWVYDHYKYWFFQCGDRLYKSESDVYRRQILTYKDGPRTEKVKADSFIEKEKYTINSIQVKPNVEQQSM